MKSIVGIIIVLSISPVFSKDIDLKENMALDCFFEKNHIYYEIESAKKDAQKAFYEFKSHIYGVANGFGPEIPGVGKNIDIHCLNLDVRLLFMGADVSGQCNQNTYNKLNKKAVDYSRAFNAETTRLFKKYYSKHPETNKCFQPTAESGG